MAMGRAYRSNGPNAPLMAPWPPKGGLPLKAWRKMRKVVVRHYKFGYLGRFLWLEKSGLDDAARWAVRHGYLFPLFCVWDES